MTPRERRVRREALGSASATAIAVGACPRVVYRGDPVSTLKIIDVGSPLFVEFSPNGEIRQSWLYRKGYLCAAEMPIGEYHMHDTFEHAGETLAVLGREIWAFPGRMQ